MLSVFSNFKSLFHLKRCLIDNTTFRLHYQFTFAILCICSALQTLTQFFGKPIDCMVEGVSKSVFDTYCWIHGTFTLPSQLTGRRGIDFPHPGVGPYPGLSHQSSSEDDNLVEVTAEGDEIRHAWYQWVIFVLFFQALLCYLPHFLWKNLEGGRISMLLQDLPSRTLDTDGEAIQNKRHMVVRYILRNVGTHNFYAAQFIICEFLNLVNIIAQMFFMDQFFNGHFTTYGAEILTISNTEMEKRVDPMAKIFPKLSKCTFHRYGPSGTIVNHDGKLFKSLSSFLTYLSGLCILPLNIINEKIYVFLWFWFMILIGWTCIFFCFRIVTIVSR